MILIDSHCHIHFPQFDDDRGQVIQNALDAGIKKMILIGTNRDTNSQVLKLAQQYEFMVCSLGVHPHDANAFRDADLSWIEKQLNHPKVVALGECGLDYHYQDHDPHKQQELFRAQIKLALKKNLPLVIHNRDAHDDTLKILDDLKPSGGYRGQWHCFDGSTAHAQHALGLGLHLGFTGPVTYKANEALRTVIAQMPLERILIETDSPYLPPVPFRGQRNEPARLPWIAQKIADVRGLSLENLAQAVYQNTLELYKM